MCFQDAAGLPPRGTLDGDSWMGWQQTPPPLLLTELMTLRRRDIPASKPGVAAKSLHKDKRASPPNPPDRRWHF